MNPSEEFQATIQSLEQALRQEGDRLVGDFQGLKLFSQFQPVFSLAHQRQIGLEAIFSGVDAGQPDGGTLTSYNIFSRIPPDAVVRMDQLRILQHLKNFKNSGITDRWIFLNLHPKIMMTEGDRDIRFFLEMLEYTGVPPQQVVVALREHSEVSSDKITVAIKTLRKAGCLTLFDDYSAVAANLDRLWALRPDMVKLQRSFIDNALSNKQALRMLNKLVSLIHASGCTVLLEKIETDDEAIIALETTVDFVEGHYFGLPTPRPVRQEVRYSQSLFNDLAEKHNRALQRSTWALKNELSDIQNDFMDCAWSLGDDQSLEDAGQRLLRKKRVERIYLLDETGHQVGPHFYGEYQRLHNDARHLPLEDSVGATFARRSIFSDAVRHPSIVQTSDPFRSISSMNTSVTLSVALRVQGHTNVLCCDVRWDEGVLTVETHGV
ncbi:MAG: EAL domain-containing protein [Magnetococcales bacterium]|nr:EAL domain-containing protein [Magnetococcales bacterium]